MSEKQEEIDLQKLQETIHRWLQRRVSADAAEWLDREGSQLSNGAQSWKFFTSFSAAPRYTGKDPLSLSREELQAAGQIRPGWSPAHWTVDQLARTYLVVNLAGKEKEKFLNLLEKTFVSSDMGEAVALYQLIPVLPYPDALQDRAAEGVRSNMTSVFNAVALRNPYPADYMNEKAWNQMVLKALFVESPLYLIQGIDRRANTKLARMLVDYAHERWAADRTVSPELWRSVGPYAGEKYLDDLERVLNHSSRLQQQAAILALSASNSPRAQEVIDQKREMADRMKQEKITWDVIGNLANQNNQL